MWSYSHLPFWALLLLQFGLMVHVQGVNISIKGQTGNRLNRRRPGIDRMEFDILSASSEEENGNVSGQNDPYGCGSSPTAPSNGGGPLSKSDCRWKRRRRRRDAEPTYPSYEELKTLSQNISRILDGVTKNYDRKVRPSYGVKPVEVGVTMFVLMISSISEVLMDFTLDFYFRQMWKDPRLAYVGPVPTLSVGSEFLKQIWVPDTFFVNEKTSYFHTATTSNEFLRISAEGDITRSMRLTVTAGCNMNLRYFPMDAQLCNIEIESYGYSMADIRYIWAKGPGSVGVEEGLSLPQFKVMGYRQKAEDIVLSTGNYSRLACEIQFVRAMGYYMIQVYIPSTLIVIISWISFFVNRNAAPARVYLGITTVLTMTTLMSSTNKELPKISYVKSIDVFLGTCFIMVFAALLEYATVGYLAKHIQMRKNHLQGLQKMATELKAKQEEADKKAQEDEALARVAIMHHHQQQELQQQQIQSSSHHHHQHHHHHHHGGGMKTAPSTPYMTYEGARSSRRDRERELMMPLNNNAIPPPPGPMPSSSSGYNLHHRDRGGFPRPPPPENFALDMVAQAPMMTRSGSTIRRGGDPEYGRYPPQQPQTSSWGRKGEKHGDFVTRVESEITQPPPQPEPIAIQPKVPVNPNQVCGITPSDIDKYSRVVFPVCFICFNLLYWITYLHVSHIDPGDLTLLA